MTADEAERARLCAAIDAGTARPGDWLRLSRILSRTGSHDAAQGILRRAMTRFPRRYDIVAEHLVRAAEALVRMRATAAARLELRDAILAQPLGDFGASEKLRAIGALIALPDLRAARRWLRIAIDEAKTLRQIQIASRLVAVVFERAERVVLRLRLLDAVRALGDDPAARPTELSLLFALDRRGDYLALFDALPPQAARDPFAIIARRWRTPLGDVLREPRVIGIGLPKTATTSFAHALSMLGYFHADHHSPVSQDYVTLDESIYYDSFTDCAAALDFESAYHLFPNARFVLTERPQESWERSLTDHFARVAGAGDFAALLDGPAASSVTLRHGQSQRLTHYATLLNVGSAAEAHRHHDQRVTSFFANKPANRLLRLNVFTGAGWPELCGFLDRDIPNGPFPRANAAP